jgi:hypothetical protein
MSFSFKLHNTPDALLRGYLEHIGILALWRSVKYNDGQ